MSSTSRNAVGGPLLVENRERLVSAYFKHETEMRRFLAKRIGSFATASDIVHDIYLKLISHRNLPPVENTRSYLFRMAANHANDHQRAETRHAKILQDVKDLIWERIDYLTPERHLLAKEELKNLTDATDSFAPRVRQAFYLNCFERIPQREIAVKLDVSVVTVEKDIQKVLKQLILARRRYQKSR